MYQPPVNPTTNLRNLIGGKHRLTENLFALSLVRKQDAQHAYLILEGVHAGERYITDVHLVEKKDSNGKKADIVKRQLTVEQLAKLGEGYHAYTWGITREQALDLLKLVEAEQARAANNEIDYVMTGKTAVGGFFGDSLEASGLEAGKEALINASHNPSADLLLRKGHNCLSWAVGLLKAVGVSTPQSWMSFIIVYPPNYVQGNKNMDAVDEPTTGCRLM